MFREQSCLKTTDLLLLCIIFCHRSPTSPTPAFKLKASPSSRMHPIKSIKHKNTNLVNKESNIALNVT